MRAGPFPGMRVGTALLAVLLALQMTPSVAQAPEPDLALGIRQVKEGDLESALVTLDLVARKLSGDPARTKDLAQAYLQMGVAYVGLGQEGLARSKFAQALKLDPNLKLSPEEFSQRTIRTFEAARQASTQTAALEKQALAKSGKKGLIVLGIGGAAAAGTAVAIAATTKERQNRPPTASIRVSPEGQAIAGVTTLTLTATASDPDGDPLSYEWRFGDNTANGQGGTVTHVYSNVGTFTVTLTVADGLTTANATTTVTVGSLDGRWQAIGDTLIDVVAYDIQQNVRDATLQITAIFAGGQPLGHASGGKAADPRSVLFFYDDCRGTPFTSCGCTLTFEGQVDGALRTMSGTLRVGTFTCCATCQRLGGRQSAITLTR